MNAILIFLLGLTVLFLLLIAAGVFWAIRNGQFDDMEGPAQRILMDDDDPLLPGRADANTQQNLPNTAHPSVAEDSQQNLKKRP